jgi:hypothetical protein
MAAESTGLGFWPKAVLWGGVIAIGVLYLSAVNDKASRDERAAPLAETAPAAEPAAVAGAPELDASPASAVADLAADASAPGAQAAPPLAPAAPPAEVVVPVAAGEGPPGEPAAVSPEEAEAFAKAVVSEPERSPEGTAPAGEQRAEPQAETVAEPAAPVAAPAPAPETMEQQRARIMAEYEAMRRRAEEDMRRRWEGMGMPGPGMMPAGPYVPGYFPPPPQAPTATQ